ncbi:hypothetical protein ACIQUU_24625 [Streptomyces sp. NPDC101116]|uniref:hypothetical protein n=1 Tax=Streptomyces sp. NPDC101116 TaxID=3366107 RepID=UPI003816DFF4
MCVIAVWFVSPASQDAARAAVRGADENHSTRGEASAMIDGMFRHAFALAASVVTDAPKAAVVDLTAVMDGARS